MNSEAVRKFIAHKINLWLTSDESVEREINARIVSTIETDASHGNVTREQYVKMLRDGASDDHALLAGREVLGYVAEMIDDIIDGMLRDMIREIIDTDDDSLAYLIGESWLPDVNDIYWPEEWPEEEEEEEEEEENECQGHESLDGAHMGETVYCDGSCRW